MLSSFGLSAHKTPKWEDKSHILRAFPTHATVRRCVECRSISHALRLPILITNSYGPKPQHPSKNRNFHAFIRHISRAKCLSLTANIFSEMRRSEKTPFSQSISQCSLLICVYLSHTAANIYWMVFCFSEYEKNTIKGTREGSCKSANKFQFELT